MRETEYERERYEQKETLRERQTGRKTDSSTKRLGLMRRCFNP